jgi:mannan endo-1,4-beta-mannosidase
VSTGSEGLKGCAERPDCVLGAHQPAEIDYLTIHVWPHNWAWMDYKDLPGTYAKGEALVAEYLAQHTDYARGLGKPLVIEEFGYPREGPGYGPGTPTTHRDCFYRQIYDAVQASAASGGPIAGSNFWSWAGRKDPGGQSLYRPRDLPRDPNELHEPPGWYDVHPADETTLAVVRVHAAALKAT